MNTDLLDLFVSHLGLSDEDRHNLKNQIGMYTLDRAAILLGDQLSPEERAAIGSVLAGHGDQLQVERIFADPERHSVLTTAFLDVMQTLLDEPEVVDPEKRDVIIEEIERFLLSKQALA